MTALRKLLTRPAEGDLDAWFAGLAEELLARYRLIANGESLRLLQIEIYYRSDDHPDPFVHSFPLQKQLCRWYLHRVGSGYRGGNYKGLDLTFGDGRALGGILFRAAETAKERIQGPSKLVDHILKVCEMNRVADLDALIGGRAADDAKSILCLQRQRQSQPMIVKRRKRVGLSMKRATPTSEHAKYLNRLYFFSN